MGLMDIVMAVAIGAIAVVLAMTTLTSRPLNLAGPTTREAEE